MEQMEPMATAFEPKQSNIVPLHPWSSLFLPRREVELGPGALRPRQVCSTSSCAGALLGHIGVLHLLVGHRLRNRALSPFRRLRALGLSRKLRHLIQVLPHLLQAERGLQAAYSPPQPLSNSDSDGPAWDLSGYLSHPIMKRSSGHKLNHVASGSTTWPQLCHALPLKARDLLRLRVLHLFQDLPEGILEDLGADQLHLLHRPVFVVRLPLVQGLPEGSRMSIESRSGQDL